MIDRELQACTLSRWEGEPTACRWCNDPLPKGRRRWCSDECGNECYRNHWWTYARTAALRRDGFACVECGATQNEARLEVHHMLPLAEIQVPVVWNGTTRKAKHGDTGCHHHLDGLRTLCCWRRDGRQSCHHRAHHGERVEQLRIEAA